jgi:ornithine cyclodeaminase
MTMVYTLDQIKAALGQVDPIEVVAAGFVAYSQKRVMVTPVGELLFEDPPGDLHIKSGYMVGAENAVIKIASGFYDNVSKGLPPSSGVVIVMSQKTGLLRAVLMDGGYLTDVRTAAAGAVVARHLAPKAVSTIGVLGAGVQARLQVTMLAPAFPCRRLLVWSRSDASAERYVYDMRQLGYSVDRVATPREIAERAQLIITATPSTVPLIEANWLQPGTHITAMGADSAGKQELYPNVLGRADIVVTDSLAQCKRRGEIYHALSSGDLSLERVTELGQVIMQPSRGRTGQDQITVADLTGLAAQDIALADALLRELPGSARADH